MARVGGAGGPRWVWPLIILLILAGLAVLGWAFLANPAPTPGPQPAEQTPEDTPTPSKTLIVRDIAASPADYYGKEVTVDGRISRKVGDQGVFLTDREGGPEILAVLDEVSAGGDLRNDDLVRLSGTIHEMTDEEKINLQDKVDKPTLDALSPQRFYLAASKAEKMAE